MLNIKTPRDGTNLNNKDRLPFTLADDSRFDYLHNMTRSFRLMDASELRYRINSLTADTNNALHMTINGIIHLIRLLLQKNMSYVLTCEFLRDTVRFRQGVIVIVM